MKKIILLCSLFTLLIGNAQETYIYCGKLIDTQNGKVLTNKTIVVSDKLIKNIQDGFVVPVDSDTKIIDLKSKTVMPG